MPLTKKIVVSIEKKMNITSNYNKKFTPIYGVRIILVYGYLEIFFFFGIIMDTWRLVV